MTSEPLKRWHKSGLSVKNGTDPLRPRQAGELAVIRTMRMLSLATLSDRGGGISARNSGEAPVARNDLGGMEFQRPGLHQTSKFPNANGTKSASTSQETPALEPNWTLRKVLYTNLILIKVP